MFSALHALGATFILAFPSVSGKAAELIAIKLNHYPPTGTAVAQIGHGCPPTFQPFMLITTSAEGDPNPTVVSKHNYPFTPCWQRGPYYDPIENPGDYTDLFTLQVPGRNITYREEFTAVNDTTGSDYPSTEWFVNGRGAAVTKICDGSSSQGYSLFFPPAALPSVEGEMAFCATNPEKYLGEIKYTSVSNTDIVHANYGGVNISPSIAPGGYPLVAVLDATIADIIFPAALSSPPWNVLWYSYLNLTGAVDHGDGNGYVLTPAQFARLKPLQLQLGCCPPVTVTLVPDAQIKPRKHITDPIRLAIVPQPDAEADQVSLGNAFFERYYLSSINSLVGFAPTPYTFASFNF